MFQVSLSFAELKCRTDACCGEKSVVLDSALGFDSRLALPVYTS